MERRTRRLKKEVRNEVLLSPEEIKRMETRSSRREESEAEVAAPVAEDDERANVRDYLRWLRKASSRS